MEEVSRLLGGGDGKLGQFCVEQENTGLRNEDASFEGRGDGRQHAGRDAAHDLAAGITRWKQVINDANIPQQ
jgi:hypothetical protein